jgi:hypothetical protein
MASPQLEKKQRISPLVPVNDEFKIRGKDRLDKSARKNIYRNCLLPVLSCYPTIRLEFLVTQNIRKRISAAANAVLTARKISRKTIYWPVGRR